MIRIAVTGMGKERIAQLANAAGQGRVEAVVRGDFDAAMAIKNGQADYYIGACQSGAGGALGVANAILGSANVARLSGAGSGAPEPERIGAVVAGGTSAFGLAHSHIEAVVPELVRAIVARDGD